MIFFFRAYSSVCFHRCFKRVNWYYADIKKKRKKLKRTEAAKLRAILDRNLAPIYGWGKNKC